VALSDSGHLGRCVVVYIWRMATVIVQGVFSVDSKERDRFVETSVDTMRSSRQEEGCLEYVIDADPLDPERAVLSERWEPMEPTPTPGTAEECAFGCRHKAGSPER